MTRNFCLTALAVGFTLTITDSANGAIVYLPSQDIPIATTFAGTSVNLETGVSADTDDLPGADANFLWGGAGVGNDADSTATTPSWQPIRISPDFLAPIDNLVLGATVDGTGTYGSGFGGSGDPNPHLGNTFTAGVPGYIGFSLETTSGINYGWMRVTLMDNQAGGLIHEWAYDNTGAGIVVGVPEPGTATLGIFALSTLLLRRKRS